LPLYTEQDARDCLQRFKPVDFGAPLALTDTLSAVLAPNGHILGSAYVKLQTPDVTVVFSGDLGRPDDPIMKPPTPLTDTDFLILESTYGDRRHDTTDPQALLRDIINRTVKRDGVVIIPSFAVERAQAVLFYLQQLKAVAAIPAVPVYLNSPMAADATRIYHEHLGEHKLTDDQYHAMCKDVRWVNSVDESKRLNTARGPMIIISASGMATGGRVLHHLKAFAPDARNTILFVGFQAGGTRGAALVAGAKSVKIHGEYVPVNAEVACIDSLSAHADYAEILDWLRPLKRPPTRTFITHGEPTASDALRHRIEEELHWACTVPDYLEQVELRVLPK
jgi:metallo-beta-lactamase family protein